jgi:hypothetical protein
MEFPFDDWFVVEAVHQHRASEDWLWFYDPDYPHSDSFQQRQYDTERPWPGYRHLARRMRTADGVANVFYFEDGVSGGDDTVTWAPGQCRSWDIPSWMQQSLSSGMFEDAADWWHETPYPRGTSRATPGRYELRVQWGGFEHRIGWAPVAARSTPFELAGLRVEGRTGRTTYRPGEIVDILVDICNDTSRSFSVGGPSHREGYVVSIRGGGTRSNARSTGRPTGATAASARR